MKLLKRLASVTVFLFPTLVFAQENAGETSAGGLSEAIIKYVVVPLLPILGSVLVALCVKAVTWLHSKEKESKVVSALAVAGDLVQSIVMNLELTMRPLLGKVLADGRLTAEEKAEIKAEALKQLKEQLPNWARDVLNATLGSAVDSWMGGLIERAHAELPGTPSPSPS